MTIGKKVRRLRQEKGWTLADLAKRSGIALSTLSRIETGRMTGTVESHLRMARVLGIRLPELYAELDLSGTPLEIYRHADTDEKFLRDKETAFKILTGGSLRRKMLPLLMSLPAGKSSQRHSSAVGTEKFIYLLKGRLEISAGQQRVELSAGDGLYLQTCPSYQTKNIGGGPVLALVISTPPAL